MKNIAGMERRTKIVCTIGPATSSRAQLRALLERGMNVARLNFSHGEPAEHAAVLAGIRALSQDLVIPAAVLQHLAGPKVRIGTLTHGSLSRRRRAESARARDAEIMEHLIAVIRLSGERRVDVIELEELAKLYRKRLEFFLR